MQKKGNILTSKVLEKSILNGNQLNNSFDFLIRNLKEKYYRSNSVLLIEILDDYYNAYEILSRSNISTEREFNFFIFSQLMAKIKSIGILKSSLNQSHFSEYRNLLLKEIQFKDKIITESFSLILSDNTIINMDKNSLIFFNNYWANYLEIFVNLHQYTVSNIKTNIRIAESFLHDFNSEHNDLKLTESTEIMNNWLKILVTEYSGFSMKL